MLFREDFNFDCPQVSCATPPAVRAGDFIGNIGEFSACEQFLNDFHKHFHSPHPPDRTR